MRYLTADEIVQINRYVIEQYSPLEPMAVVDAGALDMIVNIPQATMYGHELYPNIEDKGSVLFYNLIKKHVFANGNKRTAFIALTVFLDLNGYELGIDTEPAVEFTVHVAADDTIKREAITQWIKLYINCL